MLNISKISVIISLVAIGLAIWIQNDLYHGYAVTGGKTRAMYGINHIMKLPWALVGTSAFFLSLISIFKYEKPKVIAVTFILSLFSMLLLILDIWLWFS